MTDPAPLDARPTEAELAFLDGLVTSLVNARAAIGALQAFETQMLATATALADDQAARGSASAAAADISHRSIAAEIASALRLSDRSVQRQLSDARTITRRFSGALDALADGRISRGHLGVIVDAGASIEDDGARAAYETLAIARAQTETPGRLRPIARMLAERAQSRSVDERHGDARATRRVVVNDLDDGMAELLAILPAALAHGIHDRLTSMAHVVRESEQKTEAHPRSTDELRADLLCDLVLSGAPSGHGSGLDAIAATVHVTVPVLTLLGAGHEPACLAGHGPIDAATAKRLTAGAAGWDRVLTHPVTGAILAVDRYRPSEELRRFLRARDEHCRFPGCRISARRSDLDHTHDASLGGSTDHRNLAHLCRRHHVLKHTGTWGVEQVGGGALKWTSPTRRVYVDSPAPTLRFEPDHPPPF